MGEEVKNSEKKDAKDAKIGGEPSLADQKTQNIKDLLAKSEISLLLDSYDDIFSDFDPRPYSQRALSDDFLSESRKAARDKKGTLELRFLVPQNLRKPEQESVIKKRVREHFKRHVGIMESDVRKIVRNGAIITFIGFLLMIGATSIDYFELHGFILSFFKIILEPAGWFIVWFGLDEIFYKAKQQTPELEFYKKMVKANITFSSY